MSFFHTSYICLCHRRQRRRPLHLYRLVYLRALRIAHGMALRYQSMNSLVSFQFPSSLLGTALYLSQNLSNGIYSRRTVLHLSQEYRSASRKRFSHSRHSAGNSGPQVVPLLFSRISFRIYCTIGNVFWIFSCAVSQIPTAENG